MSNSLKTFAIIFVAFAMMVVSVPGILAQTADIQAQIASLLAQIQALQSQLLISQGSSAAAAYNFAADLKVGSKGADVTALQSFLESKGQLTMPAGVAKGYFGNVTKAALAAYQASVGISPAVGYFGPKSRAYVNSLAVATTTTTTTTTTGTTTTVAPATGLAVQLASDNPVAGSIISGAARVEVLKAAFTAGISGGVTLNGVKFTKTGVLSDTAVNNAYLIEGGKVIAQFASISGGVITFNSLNLGINAGQTRNFTLGIDPASGLTAGNTVAFMLNSASDVTAVDSANVAVTASGTFPMNGNTQTVTSVANPSIATLTIASSSVGSSVYAGTTNVLVSAWTLTAANSKVNLKSIKYTIVGSASKGDIQNVKLMVNGVQVGSTLASVASDGTAYFDLTSAPALLQTGSSNLQIYADIMGSPSFNFDFGILNTFDVLATDSTYNSPIAVTVNGGGTGSTSGHQVLINQGAITVTAASDTPTGNVAKGGSGTVLGKFNIYAAGEAVKVKFIDLTIANSGKDFSQIGNVTNELSNISLVDSAGGQIGSTISTVAGGTSSGQCTLAAGSIVCHFGVSSSPINYIIPANTTRTISAKVDVASTATSTSYTASLPAMTGSNLQGMTSSQSSNSGSASGAALTLASNALTSAQNSGFGNVTYAKGSSNVKIGSYTLTASTAEGIKVSNLTITTNASSTNFQNLKVMVDGAQIGSTQSTLTASQAITFSGNINVSAGGSKTVDVYADILSSVTAVSSLGAVTTLTSCTGTGVSTNSSISCSPTSIAGQTLTVSSGPSMSIVIGSATAATKQVVMNSTGNSLATFRFTETTNVEPIKINTLIITATSSNSGTRASFLNAKLYNGSTMIAGPVNASSTVSTGGSWSYVFNFTTAPVVPQNGSLELELKGDVASNSSAAASSNAIYTFKIASSVTDITALGQGSNTALTSSTITLSPTIAVSGNALTVVRSKLTLSSATLGSTSGRARTAIDDMANLSFTADSADPITVNSVTLKFQGLAVSTGTSVSVNLIDPSTGTDWNSGSASSCTSVGNSCSVVFTYTGSSIPTISAGTSKTIKMRVDSSAFYNNAAAVGAESLTVFVNTASTTGAANGTGINWGDGSTTNGLNLEGTIVPITISNVSYE